MKVPSSLMRRLIRLEKLAAEAEKWNETAIDGFRIRFCEPVYSPENPTVRTGIRYTGELLLQGEKVPPKSEYRHFLASKKAKAVIETTGARSDCEEPGLDGGKAPPGERLD